MPAAIDRHAVSWRELARHWETWAGLLLCGLCAGAGGYASAVYFQRSPLPVLLGGALGGLIYSLAVRFVRRRYGPPLGTNGPLANAVELYFRDEPGGRLMVPEGPRSRYGYRVRSPEQERLLRAYLSMRLWTQTAILVLGLVGAWFAIDLRNRWNAVENAGDGARLLAIVLLAYFALLVVPLLMFSRLSRRIEAEYFSALERVAVTPLPSALTARRTILALLAVGMLLAAVLLAVLRVAANHQR